MLAVQAVHVFRKHPSRVRARDVYKQRTCTTCTGTTFRPLEPTMEAHMKFIRADIPRFCEGWETHTQQGYINAQHVAQVVLLDGSMRLACYAADGRPLGYVTASAFAKAIKGKEAA